MEKTLKFVKSVRVYEAIMEPQSPFLWQIVFSMKNDGEKNMFPLCIEGKEGRRVEV